MGTIEVNPSTAGISRAIMGLAVRAILDRAS